MACMVVLGPYEGCFNGTALPLAGMVHEEVPRIVKLFPQDLRKFFGSWHLGMNKTDIMTVSKWMCHRDPRVTLSTYAKVIEELEKEHQDAIGNALVPRI